MKARSIVSVGNASLYFYDAALFSLRYIDHENGP
jgi:hypothetical protein